MKKHLLLLSAALICGNRLSAQENSIEIAAWQQKNPEVILISTDVFNSLSETERSYLKNYILFSGKIGEISPEALEKSTAQNSEHNLDLIKQEKEVIKQWIAGHPDVSIVPFSNHSQCGNEKLQVLNDEKALLLSGEVISLADIKNYPY